MLPPIPLKQLTSNSTPVEAICYVDVAKYNPLNAKDYIFTKSLDTPETQFFNYVVLGYSYLAKNERGYTYLEMTPALEYILANTKTYIKPLHQKGIRVLLEVRSGNFSSEEGGFALGFGTMDMAAINVLTEELKRLVNHYGFDGFEFNDTGGGTRAYPPLTRELTQFRSDKPLYPPELFTKDGKPDGEPLSPDEVESKLWIEGGSNFSNLIQRTNEALKETYTATYTNGAEETSDTVSIDRILLVRNSGHGEHLLSQLRMAYMPDAYSGADPKVVGNLKYIVNAAPYDAFNPRAAPVLWDESKTPPVNAGSDSDDRYAPFAIDLSKQETKETAEGWANIFLLKDPSGSRFDSNNQNRYGALYFTNLPPISEEEEADSAAYMTYFSWKLFERIVRLANSPGAGDYKKTW
jgi:hypothetical protein